MLNQAEITGDHALARAILYRGYELDNPGLVGSYFEKYPDELPVWDEFMGAAQKANDLEALGISGAAGVAGPERPQELGTQGPPQQSWRQVAYGAASEASASEAGGVE